MEILIDANALIYAGEGKIDLFNLIKDHFPQAEVIVPEEVIEEVKTVREKAKKGRSRKAASLILQIINGKAIKEISLGKGEVDDLLLEEALRRKAAVLTSDKHLKRKLKKAGVETIYLKQKRILEAD